MFLNKRIKIPQGIHNKNKNFHKDLTEPQTEFNTIRSLPKSQSSKNSNQNKFQALHLFHKQVGILKEKRQTKTN